MAVRSQRDNCRRYATSRSELWVRRNWLIDLGMYAFMILWMLLAFGSIQADSSSPLVVIGSIVIGLVGLLYLSNQKISYLQIGDKIVLETKDGNDPKPDTSKNDPQEKHR